MQRILATLVLIMFIVGGYVLASSHQHNESDPEETQQLLDEAVFTSLDGADVSLSDYRGKTVLIDIWETWCTPCLQSFPTLQDLMDDYPDDFLVLAVSPGYMDSHDDVVEFVQHNDYDFKFVFGEQLAEQLNVQSIPYKVYVGPSGEYLETSLGTRGPEGDYEKTRKIIENNR